MKEYMEAEMEVVVFEVEDVIQTSVAAPIMTLDPNDPGNFFW